MFISQAFAQAAPGAEGAGGGMLLQLLPLVLIFVVFYFLLIRPQQKKMKDHKAMIAAVRRGDRVVTGGGIIGLVTKVPSETELQVEIADGVRVRVLRSSITDVIKTGDAEQESDADSEEKNGKERARQAASGKGR
jgi:preprotein translocase subunit YajC